MNCKSKMMVPLLFFLLTACGPLKSIQTPAVTAEFYPPRTSTEKDATAHKSEPERAQQKDQETTSRISSQLGKSYQEVASPTLDGDDVLVPNKLIEAIPDFDSSKPVYAACDKNGWFVRGPGIASENAKKATKMKKKG
jgi:hypothetical protein